MAIQSLRHWSLKHGHEPHPELLLPGRLPPAPAAPPRPPVSRPPVAPPPEPDCARGSLPARLGASPRPAAAKVRSRTQRHNLVDLLGLHPDQLARISISPSDLDQDHLTPRELRRKYPAFARAIDEAIAEAEGYDLPALEPEVRRAMHVAECRVRGLDPDRTPFPKAEPL